MVNGIADGADLAGQISKQIKVYAIIFDWRNNYRVYKELIDSGGIEFKKTGTIPFDDMPFNDILLIRTGETIEEITNRIQPIGALLVMEINNLRGITKYYDFYYKYFPTYEKVTINIVDKSISVKENSFEECEIIIQEKACIYGDFQASGGLNSDITVLLLDDIMFEYWKLYDITLNIETAKAYYYAERAITGKFRIILPAGKYHLVFSNKFSAISKKEVKIKVSYDYDVQKIE